MEIGIGTIDLHRLVPRHGLETQLRLPVKLHESRLVFRVDETEGVHAEPFHEPERPRNGAVGHDPHDHVHAFGREADEIPERIMSRLRLRKVAVWLLFCGMDEVGKFDGVLDEEYRDIVADEIPVAFLRIKLDGEAAHVARKIE